MLSIIPTYEVIVDPDEDEPARRIFRVPRDKLDDFIAVLNFNGIEDYRVIREVHATSRKGANDG